MKNVFHGDGVDISSGLLMPCRNVLQDYGPLIIKKKKKDYGPLLIPCTPSIFGLQLQQSLLIVEKLAGSASSAEQDFFSAGKHHRYVFMQDSFPWVSLRDMYVILDPPTETALLSDLKCY